MKNSLLILAIGVLTLGSIGCRSFSSTMVNRNESNTGWAKEKQLRGIPVTLKVPTHIRVDVEESYFLTRNSTDKATRRIKLNKSIRNVDYNFILGEKIFVVDFKRPGAGTIDSTITFVDQGADNPDQQYFDKIVSTVTDNTIAKTTELVNTIGTKLLSGTGTSTPGKEINKLVRTVKSTVATEVFEIDDPLFEEKLTEFLGQHLNCCHDCNLVSPEVANPTILHENTCGAAGGSCATCETTADSIPEVQFK